MPEIFKNKIITILFFLIAFIWIENKLSDAVQLERLSSLDNHPNHFLKTFLIEQTNAQGAVKWNLKGKRLNKFPNSLRSEVINPNMDIYLVKDGRWNVQASHGLDLDSKFQSIYLTDNVRFEKKSSIDKREVYITTSRAILYTEDEKIETDAYATILTPDSKTTGDGVVVDLKNGYIKILQNANRVVNKDSSTEKLTGDRLIYSIKNKTWEILKKNTINEKKQVEERVKTIIRFKRD